MRSDIEIARAARLKPIAEIAAKIGAPESALHPYGRSIAKLEYDFLRSLADRPDGKLILVSAISPTPAGEGKTTTTIGLGDALNRIGRKAVICLREPSLGPCFGMKGGATGGGYAQVAPMDEINLHFTGDFHAITSAHNLLAAMIDNHMYWGNALGLDQRRVVWRRAIDMNDRSLRETVVGLGRRERISARGRIRHHGRLGSDGRLLPCIRPRGSGRTARPHGGRLRRRPPADHRS
jgi:formate--tetrahydrofolate ligase